MKLAWNEVLGELVREQQIFSRRIGTADMFSG
jgi:hypothetical protein